MPSLNCVSITHTDTHTHTYRDTTHFVIVIRTSQSDDYKAFGVASWRSRVASPVMKHRQSSFTQPPTVDALTQLFSLSDLFSGTSCSAFTADTKRVLCVCVRVFCFIRASECLPFFIATSAGVARAYRANRYAIVDSDILVRYSILQMVHSDDKT